MKINAQMRLNENWENSTEVAAGWVELEDCIKFPVKVRKYLDKESQTEKMFVSYPQRQTAHGYDSIVQPDKDIKKELDEYVLESMKQSILKGVGTPYVTDVRVTLQDNKKNLPVAIRGIASVKLAGITINGITIKEGKNGLFVQMPQHKSGGSYVDTVYGTNKITQDRIRSDVLGVYEQEVEKVRQQEQEVQEVQIQESKSPELSAPMPALPESSGVQPDENFEGVQRESSAPLEGAESIELFLATYESGDMEGMIAVLENSDLHVEQAEFMSDGAVIKKQQAVIHSGNEDMLTIVFQNSYDPAQILTPETEQKQSIEVHLYKAGGQIGSQRLSERVSTDAVEAEKDYQEMLTWWKQLTHQDIDQSQQPEFTESETLKENLTQSEGVERFLAAHEKMDIPEMLSALEKSELKLDPAVFTENWNAVKRQSALLESGNHQISLRFYNSYNPIQIVPPTDYIRQYIEAVIYKDQQPVHILKLVDLKSKSLKNAAKNYNEMLGEWMKLTNQESISFAQEKKQAVEPPEPVSQMSQEESMKSPEPTGQMDQDKLMDSSVPEKQLNSECIEKFFSSLKEQDLEGMMSALAASDMIIDRETYMEDGAVKDQYAIIVSENEEDVLTLRFKNELDNHLSNRKQKIEASLTHNGKPVNAVILSEKASNRTAEGESNYQVTLSHWKTLINQKDTIKEGKKVPKNTVPEYVNSSPKL